VLGKEEGPLQQQQQPGQVQGKIVAATVAAMQAANGGNHVGPKKIDYHLKPKILGKEFTNSELRTWCSGMIFFWAAQLMETRDEEVRWANFYDCIHSSLKDYYKPKQKEQMDRQAFNLLQRKENKQKLRRLYGPHVLVPVPMGLPSTSAEWNK
jgi:hypothetical protein